jgi:hypothetical protein
MARRKGNAVAWVHEPAELPFPPGPDHEFERRLSTELAGTTPRRPNTRFEFHLLRQVERMPEQQVKVPISVAAIVEERRESGFHHKVVFDRLELDCCRGTEAGPAAHVPRRPAPPSSRMATGSFSSAKAAPVAADMASINAIDAPSRATAQSDLRSFCMSPPVRLPNGCTRAAKGNRCHTAQTNREAFGGRSKRTTSASASARGALTSSAI